MQGIDGQYALEIRANGSDLRINSSIISHLYIINNIHQYLPSFNFAFKDSASIFRNNPIFDGTPISIDIGTGIRSMNPTLNFKSMGQPKIAPSGTYTAIGVNAVLDKIGYMKKVIDKNVKGTSADVFNEIGGMVGLKVDADTTKDFMNWLPNGTTIAQYLKHVASKSFAGEATSMIQAVTDTGVLKFKDLEKLSKSGPKARFTYDNSGLPILTYATTPKSLASNSGHGYGTSSIGLKEDGSMFEANKIQMAMMSAANSVSSSIQDAIGDLGSRINFLPPLSGNTHEKWNDAIHQNPRIKATFAYDIELLTNVVSGVDLLDVVEFKGWDPATQGEALELTGKYIITASTKLIQNNRYLEKLVLTAQAPGGV
jgi:hypothetical protein